MAPRQSPDNIIWLEIAESTNKTLREGLETYDNLSVVAAREQTAGRGQGTHTWHSTKGLNLTFSMLYNPADLLVDDMILITCATTLGIRDYLLDKGVTARIKWPNDIWVGDKKICGILIGFNLNEKDWPSDLPNPVSLRNITGETYDTGAELKLLTEKIRRRFAMTDSSDGRSKLQEEFGKNHFRLP